MMTITQTVLTAAFCVASGFVNADVKFVDHSDDLPTHSYDGGWEHFVGGVVLIFNFKIAVFHFVVRIV